jgi:glycerophosphoryl diester phosphodiesterase
MSDRFFDVADFTYAHRGLWDAATPENSIAAFHAAATAGVGVELDVRLSFDGRPLVFHDASLQRMCNHRERIERVAIADLTRWPLPDGSAIPTLEAVLDIMAGLPVLIEIKVDGLAGEIADRVAEAIADRDGPVAVMSFDEQTVARLCRLVTDRPVGLLCVADNQVEEDLIAKAAAARALGCDYIAPHHSVLEPVASASGGLPLVTWTIRAHDELQLARDYGATPIFEGFAASQLAALALSPRTPI